MTFRTKFKLKQAEKIFPAEVTKIRAEDLISKSVEQKELFSKKELNNIQKLAQDMQLGIKPTEFLFKRKGKIIETIKF